MGAAVEEWDLRLAIKQRTFKKSTSGNAVHSVGVDTARTTSPRHDSAKHPFDGPRLTASERVTTIATLLAGSAKKTA